VSNRARLVTVAALALGAGALMQLRQGPTPTQGFVSVRAAPSFQASALLAQAWALPVAATYPRPPHSQTNPSACGPTSVANLLESLQVRASASEVAAHGAGCVAGVCFAGLTLAQLRDASSATLPKGWAVSIVHPATLEALRAELLHSNELNFRYLANFHRFPLFGTGGGHHSPVAGYLAAQDLVLVLDVNASYGPFLVPAARLFEALDTVDVASGEKRGLLRFERR
jgi:hypothetical protein